MIKKLTGTVIAAGIMTTGAQALDKDTNYQIINQCKYEIYGTGKSDTFNAALLIGLSKAYMDVIDYREIDNNYASIRTIGEFTKKMCNLALNYRKTENKETGGKYDVTQFFHNLSMAGYVMTLPPEQDTQKK